ncbi:MULTISPECIES: helix-turn-helix transcriptional regulator [unclassified Saccharopolyspora]|uniref:helix-turn-helix domain-containing protein n=1 Tax=unclassified Saccharopolyspora TaxID=2646250 RepID=UPI001CD3322B|nr:MULTISPECIES: helix-turn-helix transcriptional regulator [unclassified Saccharopolyspora]MCA1190417.1 helix-turn-helix domain-containing protein [Saccharopolyspora sp. 6T]MCA1280282.1 helix-turn-helix domain-containing protein [Saccharopolyspora sp. 7B]
MAESFGQALRRLRRAAGLTQSALARHVHVDQGNISRYEHDRQRPDVRAVAALDEAVGAAGALRRLATGGADDVLDDAGRTRIERVLDRPHTLDGGTVTALAGVLAAQRRLDDVLGPVPLIAPTLAHARLVTGLVRQAAGPHRPALAAVAAEWVQFAGWLYAEDRQDREALRWLSEAEQAADEIGDGVLAAQAANFRGYIARQQQNWRGVARWFLTEHHTPGASVHQRIGAAAQAAHGASRLGDRDGARRLLDTAAELLEESGQRPAPGTAYWLTPTFHRLNLGMATLDMGLHDVAADHLGSGLDGLPEDQRHAAWTGEYRSAHARALAR